MKAKDLKIGDTFKRQGWTYKVVNITADSYLNGNDSLYIDCIGKHKLFSPNIKNEVDTVLHIKPETKIK